MIIADEPSMRRLGVEIAGGLRAGDMVTLSGTLGAGKTVLAKAIIENASGISLFQPEVTIPVLKIYPNFNARAGWLNRIEGN